ncbi:uncharacterized protein LOC128244931 [Mya arenaria]|uniref:uncharacterized protein LOC128244931 n=1 Tax=Mya arenaria TaxID=6604 RepID=UPI0022E934D2|nr:uncharacterized protein LOC128244931 [Mya arenaria]
MEPGDKEAEQLRKQIKFLSDLIENAGKSKLEHAGVQYRPYHPKQDTKGPASYKQKYVHPTQGPSRQPINQYSSAGTRPSSQLAWKRSHSNPDLSKLAQSKQSKASGLLLNEKSRSGSTSQGHFFNTNADGVMKSEVGSLSKDRSLDQILKHSYCTSERISLSDSEKSVYKHNQHTAEKARLTVNKWVAACVKPAVDFVVQEKLKKAEKEIAELKQLISERSKNLSPVKPSAAHKTSIVKAETLANVSSENTKQSISSNTHHTAEDSDTNFVHLSKYKLQKMTPTQNVQCQSQAPVRSLPISTNQSLVTNSFSKYLSSGAIQSKLISEKTQKSSKYIKKSKYSLVRVRTPSSSDKKQSSTSSKPPSKLVSLSKYSLKRIRRSLSDENKHGGIGSTYNSPVQKIAKTIRTKYKVRKIPFENPSQVRYQDSGARIPKPYYQDRRRLHSQSYYYQDLMNSHSYSSQRGWQRGAQWKTRQSNKRRKFHGYFTSWQQHRRKTYYNYRHEALKKIARLKQSVPFNPVLRLDRRKTPKPGLTGSRLIMINGMLYRSSEGQKKLVKSKLNQSGVAQKQQTEGSGTSACLVTGKSRSAATVVAASRVVSKTLAWAAARQARGGKGNKYCIFYNRFGRCNRGDSCPYKHDPERVAVCTRFLRGTCKVDKCPFSHKVSKEKMPVCSYFLKGVCFRDNCPYLHVNVGRDAEICEDFVAGYCPQGEQCKKRHIRDCPVFGRTGQCPEGDRCKLRHTPMAKRKAATIKEGLFKKVKKEKNDGGNYEKAAADRTTETGPLSRGSRLPAYISLKTITSQHTDDVIIIEDDADKQMLKIVPYLQ